MDQASTSVPPISPPKKTPHYSWKLFSVIGMVLIVSIAIGLSFFIDLKSYLNRLKQQTKTNEMTGSSESPTLFSQSYILGVTIDAISGNVLNVTASPPDVSEKKQYRILLNDKTEIVRSRIFDDSSKPEGETAFNVSDLKKGKQIVVYTDSDISSSDTLNALTIEVIPPAP